MPWMRSGNPLVELCGDLSWAQSESGGAAWLQVQREFLPILAAEMTDRDRTDCAPAPEFVQKFPQIENRSVVSPERPCFGAPAHL